MAFFRTSDAAGRLRVLEEQNAKILEQMQTISGQLSTLARRESQLRAVMERDTDLERQLPKLDHVLGKPGIGTHIESAIQQATLHEDPFPYTVIDNVLPADLYTSLIRGLPPVELFADKATNKQQLAVPFRLAPLYS